MRHRSKEQFDAGASLPAGATARAVLLSQDSSGNFVWGDVSPKAIGFLTIIGHSGIADSNGVTQPDFGPAHKVDQQLQPAMYKSIAQGGAVHCNHERGNGTNGDGGWARAATEFGRQELVAGHLSTTLNGATLANAASIIVTAPGPAPLEYLTLGVGAVTETVQVSSTYAGGATVALAANAVNAHASGDPVYYSTKNSGLLAKDAFVLIDTGGNDVPILGPGAPPGVLSSTWQSGTFGTTAGASRGLSPFMHALRFTIAQMRCAVIYRDTHPNVVYGTNWTSFGITGTQSWPQSYSFGAATALDPGNYHYTTVAGSTLSFSTPPEFPGGTVVIFKFSYHDGGGALWDYSVSGATTVAMTSHTAGTVYDDRSVNGVTQNDTAVLGTGVTTGTCFRITGLNPGVNTITVKATTLNTYGIFLGWGMEAPIPPEIGVAQQFRLAPYAPGFGYGLWDITTGGYIRRSPKTSQTATIGINQGTSASGTNVALGTAVLIGSATVNDATHTTGNTGVFPNDTITLGAGTVREETRRITAVIDTTHLQVDSNFLVAHTADSCIIGLQDADFVGGGYARVADTQGATSVPGLNGAIVSVVSEFTDGFVQTINGDAFINPPGPGVTPSASNYRWANDGVHLGDAGSADWTIGFIAAINGFTHPTLAELATYTVPNRRYFMPTFGDSYPTGQPTPGGLSQFVNGWTNYYPMSDGSVLRTGLYKDSRTREVTIQGAITKYTTIREDQLPSPAIILPSGYRPRGRVPIFCWTSMGPAAMYAYADGYVYVAAGFWMPSAPPPTTGGAFIEFYGFWYPES